MKCQTLNLESLTVESFVTGTGAEGLHAAEAGPTNRCETRLTICTIGP